MFGRLMRMLAAETLTGYQHPDVVDVVFAKTIAYEPQIEWPEIAGASTVVRTPLQGSPINRSRCSVGRRRNTRDGWPSERDRDRKPALLHKHSERCGLASGLFNLHSAAPDHRPALRAASRKALVVSHQTALLKSRREHPAGAEKPAALKSLP